jgi:hypothetical protein
LRAGWLLAAALAVSACARPEQALLEQFFGASRLRDLTALQRIATVVFEPREQGIVRSFRITNVTAERVDEGATVKDVTVAASIDLPDGTPVEKSLIVTLSRSTTAGTSGRWMVTAVREPPAVPRAAAPPE